MRDDHALQMAAGKDMLKNLYDRVAENSADVKDEDYVPAGGSKRRRVRKDDEGTERGKPKPVNPGAWECRLDHYGQQFGTGSTVWHYVRFTDTSGGRNYHAPGPISWHYPKREKWEGNWFCVSRGGTEVKFNGDVYNWDSRNCGYEKQQ